MGFLRDKNVRSYSCACTFAEKGNRRKPMLTTVQVLKAVGLGILAELTAGVLMVGVWLVGLAVT